MKKTFRKLTVALPLASFLLLPALTRAETGVQAWVQRYNGPGNYHDIPAHGIAVDRSNNVIVTGSSDSESRVREWATIKYSSAGLPLWTNRYHNQTNGHALAYALAVDGKDDVIVTGQGYNGADEDYATVKYSSAGVPLWTNIYAGPGNSIDFAQALAVDSTNNVIVTGKRVTIKYASDGVPLWTNRYSDFEGDNAYAIAVDGNNDVIVTGYFTGNIGWTDYLTVKYSSDGVLLWTNRYDGAASSSDEARAVAVDGSNDVIVTGGRLALATTT